MRRLYCYLLIVLFLLGFISPASSIQARSDAPSERILYGDSLKRQFSDSAKVFLFTFSADKGDLVTITLVASDAATLDPALALLNAQNEVIAQNDDSLDEKFGLTNARLINYPIPDTGTYTIKVTPNPSTPDGEFVLTLKGKHTGEARGTIDFGGSANGKIDSTTQSIRYEFHAEQGDVISATASSATNGTLVPSITLLDAANVTLGTNTGKAPGTASLKRILIAQDGIYTLIVSRAGLEQGTSSGNYRLSLTRDLHATLLAYGESDDNEVTTAVSQINYVFQGKAGDLVTISLFRKSSTLDPYLALTGLDGKSLATNDNATGKDLKAKDARINRFKLPADGTYIIVAGRSGGAKGTTKGKFTVALDVAKAQ